MPHVELARLISDVVVRGVLKLYRAVVIDPACRTIEEVQVRGLREETVQLVGCPRLDWFRLAEHDISWDYAWVDEFGLSRKRPVHAFLLSKRTDPIAGRCVLYGVSKEGGGTCDALFPLNVLRQEVTWLGQIIPHVDWIETERADGVHLTSVVSFERVS